MGQVAAKVYCRNCNALLGDSPGKFCPGCGQLTASHPPSFGEFGREFIAHCVAPGGKLWRTMGLLFFKPGELTREFRAGRIQQYIAPLRLYLTASFLFFLVVKFAGWGSIVHIETNTTEAAKPAVVGTTSRSTGEPPGGLTIEEPAKPVQVDLECGAQESMCRILQSRLEDKYTGKNTRDILEMLKAGMLANMPYALFLLLPLFALLTKLFYAKRGFYFGEHVVYALHVHAFTFYMLLLKATLPRYIGGAVVIAALLYYFIALQRFFGGRWWATTLRYAFIGTIYPLLLWAASAVVFLFVLVV